LNLIKSFEVHQIAEARREYEVLVNSFMLNEKVNIADVGFGVSQVLPIIVECFYCKPNSTLIIEQPEIHLHPSVQSALADLLIGAVNSRESEKDRNLQLIIESHSEHFLRRLQRRISEGIIDANKVVIYFCQPKDSGSILQKLNIDLLGNISNWPPDFFGDTAEDLIAMTKAQMKIKT
jgi:predicted ATPase